MRTKSTVIVFADLDGTILDLQSYSSEESRQAVQMAQASGLLLIFNSSKTRAEQEFYRQELQVRTPFIVENGSAIFIPKSFFKKVPPAGRETSGYHIIELGTPASAIRETLAQIRLETGLRFRLFTEMAIGELRRLTGLDADGAARAQQRDYSETIVPEFSRHDYEHFETRLAQKSLALLQGSRFHSVVSAAADKGLAVRKLAAFFEQEYGRITTAAVGDGKNDLPMLDAVDLPFLVKKPDGTWLPVSSGKIKKLHGIGPAGFSQAIDTILNLSFQ